MMEEKEEWIYCPLCGGKTRLRLLQRTVLRDFPLFCPKCRRETIISAAHLRVSVVEGGT